MKATLPMLVGTSIANRVGFIFVFASYLYIIYYLKDFLDDSFMPKLGGDMTRPTQWPTQWLSPHDWPHDLPHKFYCFALLRCFICSHFNWARRLRIPSPSSAAYQVNHHLWGVQSFFSWKIVFYTLAFKWWCFFLLQIERAGLCRKKNNLISLLMKMSCLDLLLSPVTHLTWSIS